MKLAIFLSDLESLTQIKSSLYSCIKISAHIFN